MTLKWLYKTIYIKEHTTSKQTNSHNRHSGKEPVQSIGRSCLAVPATRTLSY